MNSKIEGLACNCGNCGGAEPIDDRILEGLRLLKTEYSIVAGFSCCSADAGVSITGPNLRALFNEATSFFNNVVQDEGNLVVDIPRSWHIFDGVTYATENFEESEYACRCDHCSPLQIAPMQEEFKHKMQTFRDNYGPVGVNRGYSCPKHNATVGGVVDSQHIYGRAADIRVTNCTALLSQLFKGIILHDAYTHVDDREVPYFKDERS